MHFLSSHYTAYHFSSCLLPVWFPHIISIQSYSLYCTFFLSHLWCLYYAYFASFPSHLSSLFYTMYWVKPFPPSDPSSTPYQQWTVCCTLPITLFGLLIVYHRSMLLAPPVFISPMFTHFIMPTLRVPISHLIMALHAVCSTFVYFSHAHRALLWHNSCPQSILFQETWQHILFICHCLALYDQWQSLRLERCCGITCLDVLPHVCNTGWRNLGQITSPWIYLYWSQRTNLSNTVLLYFGRNTCNILYRWKIYSNIFNTSFMPESHVTNI